MVSKFTPIQAGYAIVEFQSPTEAKTVLDSKDHPLFHGKQLKFKQRYVKELPKGKTKSKCSWNRDKMKSDAAKMSYYLDENVVDRMKNSKTVSIPAAIFCIINWLISRLSCKYNIINVLMSMYSTFLLV